VALIQKGQAGSGGVVGTAENDLSLLLGSSGIPSQVANLTGSRGPQRYTNDGQGKVRPVRRAPDAVSVGRGGGTVVA
jgi:hypothetical protein